MLQICENIRQARERAGLSQQILADKLGLKNKSTYQNWEKTTEPDLETLKRIAEILGLPAYELLSGVIDFTPGENASSRQERDDEKEVFVSFQAKELKNIKESLNVLNSILSKPHLKDIDLPASVQRIPLGNKAAQKHSKKKGTS